MATHMDSLRDAMTKAVETGLSVFVSEYGICDANGNGVIDKEQADSLFDVTDRKTDLRLITSKNSNGIVELVYRKR